MDIPESIMEIPDYRHKCMAFPIIDHTDRKLVEETIFYCKPELSFYDIYIFSDRVSKMVE